eukprot:358486-Alexandrium_andersonii.AAC.1
MSASLVGSEMCIRDSLRSSTTGSGRTSLARTHARWRRRAQRAVHEDPVSYTHLTLPTICSV